LPGDQTRDSGLVFGDCRFWNPSRERHGAGCLEVPDFRACDGVSGNPAGLDELVIEPFRQAAGHHLGGEVGHDGSQN
jgi:hypothetical protein